MEVNGTLMNYFIHCPRQCYLHAQRLNMEDNSENVKIGKALHEQKSYDSDHVEVAIDHIRIDKLTTEYLTEIKKSDADAEACRWQLIYYLYVLKQKGIIRKGKLGFIEKNRSKKTEIIELDENLEIELMHKISDLRNLINDDQIPQPIRKNSCKKCAYYEYCYI